MHHSAPTGVMLTVVAMLTSRVPLASGYVRQTSSGRKKDHKHVFLTSFLQNPTTQPSVPSHVLERDLLQDDREDVDGDVTLFWNPDFDGTERLCCTDVRVRPWTCMLFIAVLAILLVIVVGVVCYRLRGRDK